MNESYAGKRALVAGGLGFVGSNLALRLVDLGAEVTIVDALVPGSGATPYSIAPIRDRVRWEQIDLREQARLRSLVRGQDVVFNLACKSGHLESMLDPMADLEMNQRAHLSLLEALAAENREALVVHTSTRQVYGRPRYLPVDERHPVSPVDVNGVHHLAAEMYYRLYRQVYGVRSVCLRMTNTYGPRMDIHTPRKGFVALFVRRALLGEPICVYGTGRQQRDFNYVDDVVEALLLAGSRPIEDGPFNLAHPQHNSLLEFVATLRHFGRFEYHCVPFPKEQASIDIGDYWGSCDRFSKATGWCPQVDLEHGLERTMQFFQEHREQYL